MLPIVQFDPATMSLWYDVNLISSADNSGIIAHAVADIVAGYSDKASLKIELLEDQSTRNRAIQIVSAFWHEKRHFLDFNSTNYGAFRFRQFLEVYTGLPGVVSSVKASKKLFCPIEIYNDSVRSRVMGITDPPDFMKNLASILSKRRKMVEKDRQRFGTRFGSIELGGEAQLEALAYLSQARFVFMKFGLEGAKEFSNSIYNKECFMDKYFSVIEIAARVGIVPLSMIKEEIVSADTLLLETVLFAALQTDYLPSRLTALGAKAESSYPADRFAALGVHLKSHFPNIDKRKAGEMSFEESWNIVNDACIAVFGYSICEQINRDIDYFEEEIQNKMYGKVPEDIENITKDYFRLRRHIYKILKDKPELIFSTEMFALETEQKIRPNYVICANEGVIGDPPAGFDRLIGYCADDCIIEDFPYRKWWWACAPKTEYMKDLGYSGLHFQNPKSWYSCIEFYAPLAKLLMNGRKIRTVFPVELMVAQQKMKANYSIDVEFYPSFEFPEENIDVGVYYFYYGKSQLKCDLSSHTITTPSGKVLTPWALRRWEKLGRYVIENLGSTDYAYYHFLKDWTPWVISDEAYGKIAALMD